MIKRFNNRRYITQGIKEEVTPEIFTTLFKYIDNLKAEFELDYLQVFELSSTGNTQIIMHKMEVPLYQKKHSFACETPLNNIRIFIIDNGFCTTAMLAEEY